MKRLFWICVLMLCGSFQVQAKPVDKAAAARVAVRVLQKQVVDATPAQFTECYLFAGIDGKGFALIAADDCVRPLLGYSHEGTFDADKMPPHVAAWIDGYQREIAAVREAGVTPSETVVAEWWQETNRKSGESFVAPLLSTRWAQRSYYNYYCPYDAYDSAYAVTGCVATAMAQIMKYWEWPLVGWGSHAYVHHRYDTLSADFGNTIYRWDRMPDTLNALCDSLEIDAVATLMYHAGVAVNMNYSTTGSGAPDLTRDGLDYPCAENAFKTYFRYNAMISGRYKANFSDSQWDSMLYAELDAARPVFYCGYDGGAGGHAFVLDGYDTLGMFHLNWGWGGTYDAYYTVDSLSPGAGSMGGDALYTFNLQNRALFNIYPMQPTLDTVVHINFAVNDPDWGTVEGVGTYHPYDTVAIIPHASEGYRYQRFASGQNNIPLFFPAVNDVTDTVVFERIEGDTIGYCNDYPFTAWHDDYSSVTEWGIRIPPVMRNARQLTAVQLYVYMGANFTMNIYKGDSIGDAAPVYTDQYYITDEETGWHTLPLDSMLTFGRSEVVWITFRVDVGNGRYPASCATFCGNSDGSWYHLPDGWHPYDSLGEYYTWMIRTVFSPREWLNVVATPNDINFGDVMGMGHYAPGDVVTLHAIPHNGYQFSNWSNGSTDNPMTFVITSDTAFIAFFEPVTGIGDIDAGGLRVTAQGLTIRVENTTGLPVDLYDIQGRHLTQSSSHSVTFTLPASGVYLLKIAGLPARKIVAVK